MPSQKEILSDSGKKFQRECSVITDILEMQLGNAVHIRHYI